MLNLWKAVYVVILLDLQELILSPIYVRRQVAGSWRGLHRGQPRLAVLLRTLRSIFKETTAAWVIFLAGCQCSPGRFF